METKVHHLKKLIYISNPVHYSKFIQYTRGAQGWPKQNVWQVCNGTIKKLVDSTPEFMISLCGEVQSLFAMEPEELPSKDHTPLKILIGKTAAMNQSN